MVWMEWWIVLALSLTSRAFECPERAGCGPCRRHSDGTYRFDCTDSNDSVVGVSIRPDEVLSLTCPDFFKLTDFHLAASRPVHRAKKLDFIRCDLPQAGGLGNIARLLLTEDVEILDFRSYKNLSSALTKESQLRGFNSVRELTLSNNGLSELPEDLLDGLDNLTVLNLRENTLQRLPDEFFRVPNLEVLELSFNDLESFVSTAFNKLRRLNTLDLRNNRLVEILPNTFDGLLALETLNIQRNYLQTLPVDVFARLENLKLIDLSGNNFTANSFPADLFRNNSNLEGVALYENRGNLTTLPNGFFADLSKLEAVILSRCGLTSLPEDLFRGAINLRNLSLRANNLSSLPSRIFRDTYELHIVDLSFNNLSYLPDDVFTVLRKLAKLDLSKNPLTTISQNLFSSLSSLRQLNMELDSIENINNDAFNFINHLTIAKLSHNYLTLRSPLEKDPHVYMGFRNLSSILTKKILRGFAHIKELTLSNNELSELPEDLLDGLEDLTLLNLGINNLQHLPDRFLSVSNLEVVDLGSNDIESLGFLASAKLRRVHSLNISNNDLSDFPPNIFDNFESLKTLSIHKNHLTTLPSDLFSRLANLEFIDLSRSSFIPNSLSAEIFRYNMRLERVFLFENKKKLMTLPDGFFTNLTRLAEVKLHEIGLHTVPEGLFRGAINLRNISLRSNYLETLPSRIFNDTRELSALDLSTNNLRELPDDVFDSLVKLVDLDLSDNQLTTISDKLLTNLLSLRQLDLERNNIKKIHVHALNGLTSLNTVKFSFNPVVDEGGRDIIFRVSTRLNNSYPKYPGNAVYINSYKGLDLQTLRSTFESLIHMKELMLSNNGFTQLPADFLHHLDELTLLNLERNLLKSLPDTFFSVPSLRVVELSFNHIVYFPPTAFDELHQLKLLNISYNHLGVMLPRTFDNLESLEELNIRENRLKNLPSGIFARLANLDFVDLSGNEFYEDSLPPDLFRNSSNLVSVALCGNKGNMKTLPNGFFSNLPKLEEVELRENNFIFLPEDLFRDTTNLKIIDLGRNNLSTLPGKIFRDNYELSTLDLSFNELVNLSDKVFGSLEKLIILDLSRNRLTNISQNLFRSLVSLRELRMAHNNIVFIQMDALHYLPNLEIEKLSYNSVTVGSFLGSSFWDPDANFVQPLNVDLRYNNISRFHLPSKPEMWATGRSDPRHVVVSIENNPIRCDCKLYDLLRYLEGRYPWSAQTAFHFKIGELKCGGPPENRGLQVANLNSKTLKCNADDLEFGVFSCPEKCRCYVIPYTRAFSVNCRRMGLREAPQILNAPGGYRIELYLSGNSLTKMPTFDQPGYEEVRTLALDYNRISSISLDQVPHNLEILRLNNNNLTRISQDTMILLNNASSLNELTLRDNPWSCDCENQVFLNFVQWKRKEIKDLPEVTCFADGTAILNMESRDFCPEQVGWIIGSCLVVAFMGMIFGGLAALYYRYQREVKVWIYARQWCLWLVTEDELDRDKLYDAFISFSHKDEDFVVNHLVPRLEEGPRPFKLCVHYRDWLAGEFIPKQIARSVKDSRRTIVVLSPNFVESVWGRMEFRAAHSQALSEGRARVIVILYGDIGPTDDLDTELKAYLSMNTYVKWGDPWFWEKLKYALPHSSDRERKNTRMSIFETTQPLMRTENDKSEVVNTVVSTATSSSGDALKVSNGLAHNCCDESLIRDSDTPKTAAFPDAMTKCGAGTNNSQANRPECTSI